MGDAANNNSDSSSDPLISAMQAAGILGVTFTQWRMAIYRHVKGSLRHTSGSRGHVYRAPDSVPRTKLDWMPMPVEGTYQSREALYRLSDVQRLKQLGYFRKTGRAPKAPRAQKRAEIKEALRLPSNAHLSARVLANACGVSARYVGLVRKELGAEFDPTQVKGRDGRTMNIANNGRKSDDTKSKRLDVRALKTQLLKLRATFDVAMSSHAAMLKTIGSQINEISNAIEKIEEGDK